MTLLTGQASVTEKARQVGRQWTQKSVSWNSTQLPQSRPRIPALISSSFVKIIDLSGKTGKYSEYNQENFRNIPSLVTVVTLVFIINGHMERASLTSLGKRTSSLRYD